MIDLNKIVAKDGYLVDGDTGEKVVWYECDPDKNTLCDKRVCRAPGAEDADVFGFCSKTAEPQFRKDGTAPWYAVLKPSDAGEPYWGREYLEARA